MIYLILLVLLICIVVYVLDGISTIIYKILTLSFLPHGIGMFDGHVSTYFIPLIGPIINYIVAAFINIVDFFIWPLCKIPGVYKFIDLFYRSPDLIEHRFHFIFGEHRNFITHSILNPVFLIFLLIVFIISKLLRGSSKGIYIRMLLFLIGLTFVCHLLADTMPKGWQGTATIKAFLFFKWFNFSPVFSELWLYINSGLSLWALYKATFSDD